MNTKTLSDKALVVVNQYTNFSIGNARCSIPYFNNKHSGARASLRANIGKGSPKDIFDEVESISILEKVNAGTLDSITFKNFLVDHNIGIDCSGLVYHVLSAESEAREKGVLDKHLSFPLCTGLLGKIRCKLRPIENAGVTTFAHDKNSRVLNLTQAEPGDIVTMIGNKRETTDPQRDHIVLIHQIEYQNFMPTTLHYIHAIAWPTDGEYGHGVREGRIEIVNPIKPLSEQRWIENEKTDSLNYTLARAIRSKTELRRLNWL